jgi:Tfp pilus assembly protein PilW
MTKNNRKPMALPGGIVGVNPHGVAVGFAKFVCRRKHRRGISLIETIIAVALSAGLLTSLAMAFQAACMSVENNNDYFRAVQSARLCVSQFTRQIRQAQKVQTVSGTSVDVIDATGHEWRWDYVAATQNTPGEITLTDVPNNTSHPIATAVTGATFACKTGPIPNHTTWPVQVSIVLAVKNGNDQVMLSGGASPRQEIVY